MRISDWSSDVCSSDLKGNRTKQLAIMDSDGGNHKFITNGQALALSPRFSPDYKKIVYVSYLADRVRVFIYNVDTGSQKIGRASCRDRVCQDVKISVVADALNKTRPTTVTSIHT